MCSNFLSRVHEFISDNESMKTSHFGLLTSYINIKRGFSQRIISSWSKLTKTNYNSNNVHYSGVRPTYSPYLVIKSAFVSFAPIMTRCGPQVTVKPAK